MMFGANLLLTGLPGVGKTTVLRKVASQLERRTIIGFLTDEIRIEGKRVGFLIESFDGQKATLSHVDCASRHRVGRYRVDVAALDRTTDATLGTDRHADVFIIDEIGRMECFSRKFVEAMTSLLDSDQLVIATVARKGGGFIGEVKQRPDVEIWDVTRDNRDALADKIVAWLRGKWRQISRDSCGIDRTF